MPKADRSRASPHRSRPPEQPFRAGSESPLLRASYPHVVAAWRAKHVVVRRQKRRVAPICQGDRREEWHMRAVAWLVLTMAGTIIFAAAQAAELNRVSAPSQLSAQTNAVLPLIVKLRAPSSAS